MWSDVMDFAAAGRCSGRTDGARGNRDLFELLSVLGGAEPDGTGIHGVAGTGQTDRGSGFDTSARFTREMTTEFAKGLMRWRLGLQQHDLQVALDDCRIEGAEEFLIDRARAAFADQHSIDTVDKPQTAVGAH